MTSAPEPGSPADLDQQRHEAEYKARELESRRHRRNEGLVIMASVIASGIVTPDTAPAHVADRAVDIALHIIKRVEALP